ncbi:CUE domain-containing protein [Mycena kentingensis (nom. inval.)]|nr:CUE domain-containing protein [Mycena kentingensis (nom. inval.)]
MLVLPPYPSPVAWRNLPPSQAGSIRATIFSALLQCASLPASQFDRSAAVTFISTYARDNAGATLDALVWGTEQPLTKDAALIRKSVLVLAGKLRKELQLEALVDLAIVYARSNATQMRAILVDVPIAHVHGALLPALTQLLAASQGLYALRKTGHCVMSFLAVCPTEALRVFARDKDLILALATAYETGLAGIARSYGGLELETTREADEWERLLVETKVSLIDAFHILVRTILADLAAAKGAALAVEADRTFDIIFALLSVSPSSSSGPTPFYNRTLLADYQQTHDLARTLATALRHTEEKDARLDILEDALHAFGNERQPGALKILLRSSGIAPGVDNLGKGKGKAPAAPPPIEEEDPEIDLQVSQVLDILPEHDPVYIKALLRHPSYNNASQVIDALLEGNAPPLEVLQSRAAPDAAAIAARERRNVFDEEVMDLEKLRVGKKAQTETTILGDRTFIEQMKADILRRAEAISDEEEDDNNAAIAYLEDEVNGVRVVGDGEESDSGESEGEDKKLTPETVCQRAYLRDPHLFDRDPQTRRDKARAELKEQTGWGDEQIEGWRIMLEKDPKAKEKLMRKHEFKGNQNAIASTPSTVVDAPRGGTRRKSARLSAVGAQVATAIAAQLSRSPSPLSNLSDDDNVAPQPVISDEGSADESDYVKRRPTKKQKTTAAQPKGKGKGKAIRGNNKECLFVDLPLDVLCEILRRCSPQDLVSLSRTSRIFRSHLLSKAGASIWKAAREYDDGPPVCPGMSEQQWAHLLYGNARCQVCNAINIQRVDFGLCRRVCVGCLKQNLVVTKRFKLFFPDDDIQVLDLLSYTNIGGHSHGHASNSKFYWHDDIKDMIQRLAAFNRDIQMRIPGAKKKKEEFINEREAAVEKIQKHTEVCTNWLSGASNRREKERDDILTKRDADITAKLLAMGYLEKDIRGVRHSNYFNQAKPLTERGWTRIKAQLEQDVCTSRDHRLRNERAGILRKRKEVVQGLYDNYKWTLVPSQWAHLPNLDALCFEPAFKAVIDSPIDVDIDASHFTVAMQGIAETILAFQEARNAMLVSLVESIPAVTEPGEITPQTRSLDSATIVFTCKNKCGSIAYHSYTYTAASGLYVGREATAHCCKRAFSYYEPDEPIKTVFVLSTRGMLAATWTRPTRGFCVFHVRRGGMGGGDNHYAYTWRSAIAHFCQTEKEKDDIHATPNWRKLDDQLTERTKRTEGADNTLSWACNHCAHNLEKCETRAKVAEHIRSTHAIAHPAAPKDLFRMLNIPRNAVTLTIPNSAIVARQQQAQAQRQQQQQAQRQQQQQQQGKFNCLLCTGGSLAKRTREFILDGVKSHIKAVHKIPDGALIENVHWKKVVA